LRKESQHITGIWQSGRDFAPKLVAGFSNDELLARRVDRRSLIQSYHAQHMLEQVAAHAKKLFNIV
jgi:hypothetical protein